LTEAAAVATSFCMSRAMRMSNFIVHSREPEWEGQAGVILKILGKFFFPFLAFSLQGERPYRL
jgi:hypothetical protein